jgi:hypothetical protein
MAEYVACVEAIRYVILYKTLIGNMKGKELFGDLWTWMVSGKMEHKGIGCEYMNCIGAVQN